MADLPAPGRPRAAAGASITKRGTRGFMVALRRAGSYISFGGGGIELDYDNHKIALFSLHTSVPYAPRMDRGWRKEVRMTDGISPGPGCTRGNSGPHGNFNLHERSCCRFAAGIATGNNRFNVSLRQAATGT